MTKDDAQYYSDEVSAMNLRLQDMEKERDELREALEALIEDGTGVAYDNPEDEAGYYTCCRVTSYRDHAAACPVRKARAILAKYPKL